MLGLKFSPAKLPASPIRSATAIGGVLFVALWSTSGLIRIGAEAASQHQGVAATATRDNVEERIAAQSREVSLVPQEGRDLEARPVSSDAPTLAVTGLQWESTQATLCGEWNCHKCRPELDPLATGGTVNLTDDHLGIRDRVAFRMLGDHQGLWWAGYVRREEDSLAESYEHEVRLACAVLGLETPQELVPPSDSELQGLRAQLVEGLRSFHAVAEPAVECQLGPMAGTSVSACDWAVLHDETARHSAEGFLQAALKLWALERLQTIERLRQG